MLFYNAYASKHNKETLMTLKFSMTVCEFLDHVEFLDQVTDLEEASYKQLEADRQHK